MLPTTIANLLQLVQLGQIKALARAISLVENNAEGSNLLLQSLHFEKYTPVIGITGPPGAGKSTLSSALTALCVANNKKVAIVAVDPTSPFNYGALLGDRIRFSQWFNHPNVYIRSVATRGSLGGLSEKIIEIIDVIKQAPFDYIFVETVGVGQSEVEIAGLADTTVVVFIPEAGDEIQTMKAGIMEIADIFVVNKADRPQADLFALNLKKLVHERPYSGWKIPVLKTVATANTGIAEVLEQIENHTLSGTQNPKRLHLLTQKALHLIQQFRMSDVNTVLLQQKINHAITENPAFNLYAFLSKNGYMK